MKHPLILKARWRANQPRCKKQGRIKSKFSQDIKKKFYLKKSKWVLRHVVVGYKFKPYKFEQEIQTYPQYMLLTTLKRLMEQGR